jgi:hypothetical protein
MGIRDSVVSVQGTQEQSDSMTDPNEAVQQLAIAIGALTIALIDGGVITKDEHDRAYAQATVIIDQEFARKRDAKTNE